MKIRKLSKKDLKKSKYEGKKVFVEIGGTWYICQLSLGIPTVKPYEITFNPKECDIYLIPEKR